VGNIQDQNYYQELVALAKKEHYEKYVEFVGGITHNELVNLLVKSKIFVYSSYALGPSTVVAEAMSCGLPIISISKGSNITMDNKITGFIVNTVQELASKTIELLKNEKFRNEIATNSRLVSEVRFSESYFFEKLHNILLNSMNK